MRDVFVDTSGLLALVVAEDRHHPQARRVFAALQADRARLVTTSYVLVEAYALLRRRVGTEAVGAFRDGLEPLLDVVWVTAAEHGAGLDLLDGLPRGVSLVDAVSFVVARSLGIERVFAFDRHFDDAGFDRLG